MREKYDKQLYLEFSGNATLKVVKEYREKYKSINKILDKNPKILSLVHTDKIFDFCLSLLYYHFVPKKAISDH
jgi:hypothetical protein